MLLQENQPRLLCVKGVCKVMGEIKITGLTFGYEGSRDNVFEDVSFTIDTDWKLGLIGRNGKGKTTLLRLLLAGGSATDHRSKRAAGAQQQTGGRANSDDAGRNRASASYEYTGSIVTDTCFDYFPYEIAQEELAWNTIDVIERIWPEYELWKVCRELTELQTDAEVLYRPFGTLSHGERTKVMLALLFSRENYFLMIDEPTNHLDAPTRALVCEYLNRKKGFILVSHDRSLLDGCVDHVLVLERSGIRIEKGNFSSWWENKERRDQFERSENEKLRQEVSRLRSAALRTSGWADQVESTKIGYNSVKEHDRGIGARAYIGEKSRKMQQRRKNLERRQERAIEEKEQLLHNIEEMASLRLTPLTHHKDRLIRIADLSLFYGTREVLSGFSMELHSGDRVVLQGKNGCGKSSLIHAILSRAEGMAAYEVHADRQLRGASEARRGDADRMQKCRQLEGMAKVPGNDEDRMQECRQPEAVDGDARELTWSGTLETAGGLIISYVSQDTSQLCGTLDEFAASRGFSQSLFKSVLRQIGFERAVLEGASGKLATGVPRIEQFSEGQKKKVLIAASLITPAHLYIWDEPLNYIDVFSRMQIEKLILAYRPTMLIVEHDRAFAEGCGTQIIGLERA